jgi:ABC-2 type transport system permease protein
MIMVSAYLIAFSARFQTATRYRAAALAGFVTQAWWALIHIMVYSAFYGAALLRGVPLTLHDVITYTWLQQGSFALLPTACDPEVAESVRSGTVSYDRLRPLDTYWWWFSRSTARITGRLVPRAVLMVLLGAAVLPAFDLSAYRMGPPASFAAGLLFTVSLAIGALVSAAIVVVLDVITVATLSPLGANAFITPLAILLSGNLVPLPLYSGSLREILLMQPFASIVDIPGRIYVAELSGRSALTAIVIQALWLTGLIALGRSQLERAMARLQVQGG